MKIAAMMMNALAMAMWCLGSWFMITWCRILAESSDWMQGKPLPRITLTALDASGLLWVIPVLWVGFTVGLWIRAERIDDALLVLFTALTQLVGVSLFMFHLIAALIPAVPVIGLSK